MGLLFDNKVCGRCGGSGKYSFNLMHGSTCYGCAGRGSRLTKRGHMAQEYFTSLCSLPASEVKPGMKYYSAGIAAGSFNLSSKWILVQDVQAKQEKFTVNGAEQERTIYVIIGDTEQFHASADTIFRIAQTGEQKKQKREQALAYQATLTVSGKTAKRELQAA